MTSVVPIAPRLQDYRGTYNYDTGLAFEERNVLPSEGARQSLHFGTASPRARTPTAPPTLTSGIAVRGRVRYHESAIYQIRLRNPANGLRIQASCRNGSAALFASFSLENLGAHQYQWKGIAGTPSSTEVRIAPNDPAFRPGTLYVCVVGEQDCNYTLSAEWREETIQLRLGTPEVQHIHIGQAQFYSLLRQPGAAAYVKVDFHAGDAQVFISTELEYPGPDNTHRARADKDGVIHVPPVQDVRYADDACPVYIGIHAKRSTDLTLLAWTDSKIETLDASHPVAGSLSAHEPRFFAYDPHQENLQIVFSCSDPRALAIVTLDGHPALHRDDKGVFKVLEASERDTFVVSLPRIAQVHFTLCAPTAAKFTLQVTERRTSLTRRSFSDDVQSLTVAQPLVLSLERRKYLFVTAELAEPARTYSITGATDGPYPPLLAASFIEEQPTARSVNAFVARPGPRASATKLSIPASALATAPRVLYVGMVCEQRASIRLLLEARPADRALGQETITKAETLSIQPGAVHHASLRTNETTLMEVAGAFGKSPHPERASVLLFCAQGEINASVKTTRPRIAAAQPIRSDARVSNDATLISLASNEEQIVQIEPAFGSTSIVQSRIQAVEAARVAFAVVPTSLPTPRRLQNGIVVEEKLSSARLQTFVAFVGSEHTHITLRLRTKVAAGARAYASWTNVAPSADLCDAELAPDSTREVVSVIPPNTAPASGGPIFITVVPLHSTRFKLKATWESARATAQDQGQNFGRARGSVPPPLRGQRPGSAHHADLVPRIEAGRGKIVSHDSTNLDIQRASPTFARKGQDRNDPATSSDEQSREPPESRDLEDSPPRAYYLKPGVTVDDEIKPPGSNYYQVNITYESDIFIVVSSYSEAPQIYVSRKYRLPDRNNATWVREEADDAPLTIQATDPEFGLGTYYIAVSADSQEASRYSIQVLTTDGPPVKPRLLLDGANVHGVVDSGRFALYSAHVRGGTRLRIAVETLRGPPAEVFVSQTTRTPSRSDYTWKGNHVVIDPELDDEVEIGTVFVAVWGAEGHTAAWGPTTASDHRTSFSIRATWEHTSLSRISSEHYDGEASPRLGSSYDGSHAKLIGRPRSREYAVSGDPSLRYAPGVRTLTNGKIEEHSVGFGKATFFRIVLETAASLRIRAWPRGTSRTPPRIFVSRVVCEPSLGDYTWASDTSGSLNISASDRDGGAGPYYVAVEGHGENRIDYAIVAEWTPSGSRAVDSEPAGVIDLPSEREVHGTVAHGKYMYFSTTANDTREPLTIELAAMGARTARSDVDLYAAPVHAGLPTTARYTWKRATDGSEFLRIDPEELHRLTDPTLYIGVHGFGKADNSFKLRVSQQEKSERMRSTLRSSPIRIIALDETARGTVPGKAFSDFLVPLPANVSHVAIQVTRDNRAGDPDLYVGVGNEPARPANAVWRRESTGSERLVANVRRSHTAARQLMIAVYGASEEATAFSLVTEIISDAAQESGGTHGKQERLARALSPRPMPQGGTEARSSRAKTSMQSAHTLLPHGTWILGAVETREYAYYKFNHAENLPIAIHLRRVRPNRSRPHGRGDRLARSADDLDAELAAENDADLYVSNTDPFPSVESYTWKMATQGSERLVIYPDDRRFTKGAYFVAVHGYGTGTSWFEIRQWTMRQPYAGHHSALPSHARSEAPGPNHGVPTRATAQGRREGDDRGTNEIPPLPAAAAAAAAAVIELENGIAVHGVVTLGQYSYFSVQLHVRTSLALRLVRKGEGDPDLFVAESGGALPTRGHYTWKMATTGSEKLVIAADDKRIRVNHFIIGVYGYSGDSIPFSLSATWEDSSAQQDPEALFNGVEVIAAVRHRSYRYFVVDAAEFSELNILLRCNRSRDGDADLYVSREHRRPSADRYTWRSATRAGETLVIASSDPAYGPGPYYVAVHGRQSQPGSDIAFTLCARWSAAVLPGAAGGPALGLAGMYPIDRVSNVRHSLDVLRDRRQTVPAVSSLARGEIKGEDARRQDGSTSKALPGSAAAAPLSSPLSAHETVRHMVDDVRTQKHVVSSLQQSLDRSLARYHRAGTTLGDRDRSALLGQIQLKSAQLTQETAILASMQHELAPALLDYSTDTHAVPVSAGEWEDSVHGSAHGSEYAAREARNSAHRGSAGTVDEAALFEAADRSRTSAELAADADGRSPRASLDALALASAPPHRTASDPVRMPADRAIDPPAARASAQPYRASWTGGPQRGANTAATPSLSALRAQRMAHGLDKSITNYVLRNDINKRTASAPSRLSSSNNADADNKRVLHGDFTHKAGLHSTALEEEDRRVRARKHEQARSSHTSASTQVGASLQRLGNERPWLQLQSSLAVPPSATWPVHGEGSMPHDMQALPHEPLAAGAAATSSTTRSYAVARPQPITAHRSYMQQLSAPWGHQGAREPVARGAGNGESFAVGNLQNHPLQPAWRTSLPLEQQWRASHWERPFDVPQAAAHFSGISRLPELETEISYSPLPNSYQHNGYMSETQRWVDECKHQVVELLRGEFAQHGPSQGVDTRDLYDLASVIIEDVSEGTATLRIDSRDFFDRLRVETQAAASRILHG